MQQFGRFTTVAGMSGFSEALVYQNTGRWNANGDALYATVRAFSYRVGEVGSTWHLDIPEGFETDLTSIPRPVRVWLDKDGPWVQAAVIHDWLYSGAYVDRALADYLLFEAMGVAIAGAPPVPWLKRHAIWLGVRLGGWRPYRRYQRAKKERER